MILKTIASQVLAASPNALFSNWKGTITNWISSAIDTLLIPIGVLTVGGILIYNLIKAVASYQNNRGEEISHYGIVILVCAIVIALLLTKSVWWPMLVH